MKVKASELTSPALDWAVAISSEEEKPQVHAYGACCVVSNGHTQHRYCPASEWSHCGPLIERFNVSISGKEGEFYASCEPHIGSAVKSGRTPQIAICRAVVAEKLGDEIDLPFDMHWLIKQEPKQ